MARRSNATLLVSLCAMSLAAADESLKNSVSPLVSSSCIDCHDAGTDTRLDFEKLGDDLTDPATFQQWEQVYDRVAKGEMPPESEPRPGAAQVKDALARLQTALKAENLAQQQAVGRVPSRRLTRLEYAYTVGDLLKIDEGGFADELAEMLPPESDSGGFDTVGATQRTSPLHIESYLKAADHAINRAISLGTKPERNRHVVDFPHAPYLSTFNKRSLSNGGSNLKQLDDAVAMFLDLDYVLRSDHCGLTIRTAGYYRITLDAYAYQADHPMTLKLVQGNPKKVGANLLGAFDLLPGQPRKVEVTTFMRPGDFVYPTTHVANMNAWSGLAATGGAANYQGEGIAVKKMFVEGPLVDQWPPASTQALLPDLESSQSRNEHVSDVVARIARQAFRRPVPTAELESFTNLAREGTDGRRGFAEAIRAPIRSILSSPQFLFLEGEPGKLDDFALASRLSYFLWKSKPDEELFQLAAKRQLSVPQILHQQVERMLDDPRSNRFVQDFVGQWFRLYDINETTPDKKLYPEFDGLLSDSISKETELFFTELIRENLSATNLIESDFTFVNRRLAEHYRLPKVLGQEMRKVNLPKGSVRGGVLGQASVLKLTSNGTFTSPVKRGAYVLTRLLGDAPNPPPPNVGSIEPDTRGATTIRETLDKHKDLKTCAQCHRKIDPPGFALECFDAIGGYRSHYRVANSRPFASYRQGAPVDASGVTEAGEHFPGIRGYKLLLLKRKDQVARQLVEQLIVYATGGEIQFADRDEISRIVNETRADEYPVRSIIHQVVQSSLMRNK